MKKARETKTNQAVWVGIDWGHEEHAVAVASAQAEVLEVFRVPNTPAGYQALDERLARYEAVAGVSVEATRHTLLLHLQERKAVLYLVNPKMSKAWRTVDSISGAKSDTRDGIALARGLAFRHANLRRVTQGDATLDRLALLCEKESHLIDQRTALVLELQSLLKVYYQAALQFFDDWTRPAAWDFLKRFPSAEKFGHAKASSVIAFLKGHRLGWSAHWKEKVEARGAALDWPRHPQEDVYALNVSAIVGQLHAIEAVLREFRGKIETDFETLPQARILASLPGAGPKLAPRLTAIVGSPQVQGGGLQALRGHAGLAPVTRQSGKTEIVCIRHMCNKTWRDTMHLFAWCSTRFSRWAGAFYKYCKARGDTHSTALRKLADKWMKILWRMLHTEQPYDEKIYLRALQRHNTQLWQFMRQQKGGQPCG
jgi:transposase